MKFVGWMWFHHLKFRGWKYVKKENVYRREETSCMKFKHIGMNEKIPNLMVLFLKISLVNKS
jgi:hypothetical protein